MDMSPPVHSDFNQHTPTDIAQAAASMQIRELELNYIVRVKRILGDDFPHWLSDNVEKVQDISNAANYMQGTRWTRPAGRPLNADVPIIRPEHRIPSIFMHISSNLALKLQGEQ